MLHGTSLSFSNLMSFMLPKIFCILLKINFYVLYAVGFFWGVGGGFLELLKPKKHFTLKEDFDICDWEEHHIWTLVC